jgi:hypothetical protein
MATNDFDFGTDFTDFIDQLETAAQPKACSIDNPDCEGCGS